MQSPFSSSLASLGLFLMLFLCVPIAMAATAKDPAPSAADLHQEMLMEISTFSVVQRDAALARAEEALAKIDARIDQLQQRIDEQWKKMDKDARQQARATLKELQQQRTEIAEWYGGLKHGSDSVWEEIKKGFSNSYSGLAESLEKAWKKF